MLSLQRKLFPLRSHWTDWVSTGYIYMYYFIIARHNSVVLPRYAAIETKYALSEMNSHGYDDSALQHTVKEQ